MYATAGTIALANIVLPDAGRLQEEEAHYANKRGSSRHSLALLREIPFGGTHQLADGIAVTLQPAGHILGAATVTAVLARSGRRDHLQRRPDRVDLRRPDARCIRARPPRRRDPAHG